MSLHVFVLNIAVFSHSITYYIGCHRLNRKKSIRNCRANLHTAKFQGDEVPKKNDLLRLKKDFESASSARLTINHSLNYIHTYLLFSMLPSSLFEAALREREKKIGREGEMLNHCTVLKDGRGH